jgi:hypothetical protein
MLGTEYELWQLSHCALSLLVGMVTFHVLFRKCDVTSVCIWMSYFSTDFEIKVKLSLCLNWAPRHEVVFGEWR